MPHARKHMKMIELKSIVIHILLPSWSEFIPYLIQLRLIDMAIAKAIIKRYRSNVYGWILHRLVPFNENASTEDDRQGRNRINRSRHTAIRLIKSSSSVYMQLSTKSLRRDILLDVMLTLFHRIIVWGILREYNPHTGPLLFYNKHLCVVAVISEATVVHIKREKYIS